MGLFDGYEEEALKDLGVTLRKLSDGTVDEGDLVIVRDFLIFLVDKAVVEISSVEGRLDEIAGEWLGKWYVQLLLSMAADELEDLGSE